MATFAGGAFIVTQPKTPDGNPNLAAQLYRYVLDFWRGSPREQRQQIPVFSGMVTRAAFGGGRNWPGIARPGLLHDFYFRIHLIPRIVNLGNVIVTRAETVLFWNAFLNDVTLSAITETATDGLAISGPLPVVAAPLAMFDYTLTAVPEGPSTIDGIFGFVVGGITYDLRVLGVRFALFPVDPNQAEPLEETLEWRTAIIEAPDGTEQAIGQRGIPRRTFSYALAADGIDRQGLEHLLWSSQWRALSIPIWTDAAALAAPTTIGATVLSLSGDSLMAFRTDRTAVLWASPSQHEVVDILTWVAGTLTTKRPIANVWPAGTEIFPGTFGHLQADWEQRRLSSVIDSGQAVIEMDPTRDEPNLPVVAAAQTLHGFEVYTVEPNWRDPPDAGWTAFRDEFDPGIGPRVRWPRQTYSAFRRGFSWLLEGRQAIQDFRAFLARRAGARVPVYMPTWQHDLTLSQNIGATDTAVRVNIVEPAGLLGSHPSRRAIAILLHTGAVIVRGISNPVNNGDGTMSLNLSSNVGQLILTTDVEFICYAPLWRMSDAVTLVWHNAELAEVSIRFRATNPGV